MPISSDYHGEGVGRRHLRPDQRVDQHRTASSTPAMAGACQSPVATRTTTKSMHTSAPSAGMATRNLEIAGLLALPPLEDEQRAIHHGKDQQKQQHGRRGKLGDGAEQSERRRHQEQCGDGDMGRATIGMNFAEAERQQALMRLP